MLPSAPLANWLFNTLRLSALSFGGDMTNAAEFAARTCVAGANHVSSKSRKNCSPLALDGQSYSVKTPRPVPLWC